ncbi:O-antigen ligase family protein [Phreatobacter sp.]|uniref:O-antigen ligase family protein n=1 Tax=Phreatobacter sp. TaxID=1966341 RepID=UPI003F703B60
MSSSVGTGRPEVAAGDLAELARYARVVLFIAAFLLAWFTLEPYADLTNTDLLELASGREGATYLAFGLIAAGSTAVLLATQPRALLALLHPAWIAMAIWLPVTVLTSQDFGTSLRRFVLFGLVAAVSAALFLLPRGRLDLARLLAVVLALVLGFSYAGAVLAPEMAIHQATDILEPQLAGDWRGVFAHKNTAGAIFVMGLFMAIYVARSGLPGTGAVLVLACLVFVALSGAKSSTMLMVITLAVSAFVVSIRFFWIRAIAMLSPLVVLLALGPGTVVNETLARLVAALPVDVTFTGRTDIWEFALEKIAERPLTGWGFSAFWTLESTRYGAEDLTQWAGKAAAHAHNGYLDAALNLGLPGLALTVLVLILLPMRDFQRARRDGADPALSIMLLQIWLFGTYLSVMESFLFMRFDPIWITFLFAVFGLRYLARYPHASA